MTSTTPTPIRIRLPLRPCQIAQRDEHDPEPHRKYRGNAKPPTQKKYPKIGLRTPERQQWYLHKSKKVSYINTKYIFLPCQSLAINACQHISKK